MANFGFGDFIIRNPANNSPIMTIRNLKDMQENVFKIPAESLLYHASHNDISRWLYSRALFPIADVVKRHHFTSLEEAPAVKQLFFDLIIKYRKMKNRGVVAVFKKTVSTIIRISHVSDRAVSAAKVAALHLSTLSSRRTRYATTSTVWPYPYREQ